MTDQPNLPIPNLYREDQDELVSPQTPTKSDMAQSSQKPQSSHRLAYTIAISAFLGMIVTVLYGGFIMMNPYSEFNIVALPTPEPIIITATFLPPTVTVTPSATQTIPPIETITPLTNSPSTQVTPTLPDGASILNNQLITPTRVASIRITTTHSPYPFVISHAAIHYIENSNSQGCNWHSIAGTVVNQNNTPIRGMPVKITNQLTEEENIIFSGNTTFGEGGFELPLGNTPKITPYWVQLIDADTLNPLSNQQMIVTSDKCSQNVVFVQIQQIQPF